MREGIFRELIILPANFMLKTKETKNELIGGSSERL